MPNIQTIQDKIDQNALTEVSSEPKKDNIVFNSLEGSTFYLKKDSKTICIDTQDDLEQEKQKAGFQSTSLKDQAIKMNLFRRYNPEHVPLAISQAVANNNPNNNQNYLGKAQAIKGEDIRKSKIEFDENIHNQQTNSFFIGNKNMANDDGTGVFFSGKPLMEERLENIRNKYAESLQLIEEDINEISLAQSIGSQAICSRASIIKLGCNSADKKRLNSCKSVGDIELTESLFFQQNHNKQQLRPKDAKNSKIAQTKNEESESIITIADNVQCHSGFKKKNTVEDPDMIFKRTDSIKLPKQDSQDNPIVKQQDLDVNITEVKQDLSEEKNTVVQVSGNLIDDYRVTQNENCLMKINNCIIQDESFPNINKEILVGKLKENYEKNLSRDEDFCDDVNVIQTHFLPRTFKKSNKGVDANSFSNEKNDVQLSAPGGDPKTGRGGGDFQEFGASMDEKKQSKIFKGFSKNLTANNTICSSSFDNRSKKVEMTYKKDSNGNTHNYIEHKSYDCRDTSSNNNSIKDKIRKNSNTNSNNKNLKDNKPTKLNVNTSKVISGSGNNGNSNSNSNDNAEYFGELVYNYFNKDKILESKPTSKQFISKVLRKYMNVCKSPFSKKKGYFAVNNNNHEMKSNKEEKDGNIKNTINSKKNKNEGGGKCHQQDSSKSNNNNIKSNENSKKTGVKKSKKPEQKYYTLKDNNYDGDLSQQNTVEQLKKRVDNLNQSKQHEEKQRSISGAETIITQNYHHKHGFPYHTSNQFQTSNDENPYEHTDIQKPKYYQKKRHKSNGDQMSTKKSMASNFNQERQNTEVLVESNQDNYINLFLHENDLDEADQNYFMSNVLFNSLNSENFKTRLYSEKFGNQGINLSLDNQNPLEMLEDKTLQSNTMKSDTELFLSNNRNLLDKNANKLERITYDNYIGPYSTKNSVEIRYFNSTGNGKTQQQNQTNRNLYLKLLKTKAKAKQGKLSDSNNINKEDQPDNYIHANKEAHHYNKNTEPNHNDNLNNPKKNKNRSKKKRASAISQIETGCLTSKSENRYKINKFQDYEQRAKQNIIRTTSNKEKNKEPNLLTGFNPGPSLKYTGSSNTGGTVGNNAKKKRTYSYGTTSWNNTKHKSTKSVTNFTTFREKSGPGQSKIVKGNKKPNELINSENEFDFYNGKFIGGGSHDHYKDDYDDNEDDEDDEDDEDEDDEDDEDCEVSDYITNRFMYSFGCGKSANTNTINLTENAYNRSFLSCLTTPKEIYKDINYRTKFEQDEHRAPSNYLLNSTSPNNNSGNNQKTTEKCLFEKKISPKNYIQSRIAKSCHMNNIRDGSGLGSTKNKEITNRTLKINDSPDCAPKYQQNYNYSNLHRNFYKSTEDDSLSTSNQQTNKQLMSFNLSSKQMGGSMHEKDDNYHPAKEQQQLMNEMRNTNHHHQHHHHSYGNGHIDNNKWSTQDKNETKGSQVTKKKRKNRKTNSLLIGNNCITGDTQQAKSGQQNFDLNPTVTNVNEYKKNQLVNGVKQIPKKKSENAAYQQVDNKYQQFKTAKLKQKIKEKRSIIREQNSNSNALHSSTDNCHLIQNPGNHGLQPVHGTLNWNTSNMTIPNGASQSPKFISSINTDKNPNHHQYLLTQTPKSRGSFNLKLEKIKGPSTIGNQTFKVPKKPPQLIVNNNLGVKLDQQQNQLHLLRGKLTILSEGFNNNTKDYKSLKDENTVLRMAIEKLIDSKDTQTQQLFSLEKKIDLLLKKDHSDQKSNPSKKSKKTYNSGISNLLINTPQTTMPSYGDDHDTGKNYIPNSFSFLIVISNLQVGK